MDDKKKMVSTPCETDDNNWTSTFFLSLFLLLEAAAFISVTIWQENSLQTFSHRIVTGNRLIAELEAACAQHGAHNESETRQQHSRKRRQSLSDLFQELLTTQGQLLRTACQRHLNLCQFGPKGEIGDQGNIGPSGSEGLKGEQGRSGPPGNKGQPGLPGETGSVGQPGPQGIKGNPGPEGPAGIIGETGPKGSTGETGPPGSSGQAGVPGQKGDPGPQGEKGPQGQAGENGPKGEEGDAGDQGAQGEPGVVGPKGSRLEGDCLCAGLLTITANFTETINAEEGQSVTLHCEVDDPEVTITWQRTDGKPMAGNVQVTGNDLSFSSLSPDNAGFYQCKATSPYGSVGKTVEIKLEGPSPWDCNFEQDLCTWTQGSNDKFDWTRNSGPTPTAGTGPSIDHTLGTGDGNYIFIETSGSRLNGDHADLVSTTLDPGQPYCITFWYHLFGTILGNVNVRINKNGAVSAPLWMQDGPSEDAWKRAAINILPQTTPFRVVIEGVRGESYNGDAAIDDIVVKTSPCP